MRLTGLFLSVVLLPVIFIGAAVADTAHLVNGDRIQGRVVAEDVETVTLETEYAGTVTIRREAIVAIVPDAEEAASPDPADTAAGPVEPVEPEAESAGPRWRDRWTGSLDAGLTLRSGNTDSLDAQTAAEFIREVERNKLTIKLAAQYGEVERVINARGYRGEAKWQVYPRERFFVYFQGAGERDDARKLDYRFTAGVGLGYDAVKRERAQLSVEGGAEYAWERWNPFTPAGRDRERARRREEARAELFSIAGGGALGADTLGRVGTLLRTFRDPLADAEALEEDYTSLRIGLRYQQKLWGESKLTNALTLLPNLGDLSEFRAANELAFETPLSPRLALRVALSTAYDSLAETTGADPWDNRLVTGLRLKF